jgi:hypothetical protein
MYRLILLLLIACSTAGAATVYRTVDENGVVTFSDTPPSVEVPVETMEIDTPAPQDPAAHQQRLEDMRETTDRMAADRRERERHRAELREIDARTQAYQTPAQPVYDPYGSYLPVYGRRSYSGHYRPPWRPGYKPRPEHPIARPPLRPSHYAAGGNDQLMRPMISSRAGSGSGTSNAQLMRPMLSSGRK